MKLFFQIFSSPHCSSNPLSTIEWYLVLTSLCIVLSQLQLQNLNSIAGLSLIGAITASTYSTMVWVLFVSQTRPPSISYEPLSSPSFSASALSILNALGIIAFAFSGHNLSLEIEATMPSTFKHPAHVERSQGCLFFHCNVPFPRRYWRVFVFWEFGGNLEKFIQERSERAVDWRALHKIAIEIARALAYLHDQCVPRILHRDVKPSNILLDNDFNAYLSDFGLARHLGTSGTHAIIGVAGTFGYVALEYAMTCHVSDKADVYSYDVVLLELISDKKALDPSFSSFGNGFNKVGWVCMLLR